MTRTDDQLLIFAQQTFEQVEHLFEHHVHFKVSHRSTRKRWATTHAGFNTSSITLYANHLAALDAVALRDVILHELAHSLQWERYSKMSHDEQWRDFCEGMGAMPRAFATESERIAYASTRSL